jgi:hypothetical protein
MNKKKIVICGDSFMTPILTPMEYQGTHFSEIIAEKLNYELVCLSKAGMCNIGIAIAIEDAIKLTPELILVGTTYHGRQIWPTNFEKFTNQITFDDIIIDLSSNLSTKRDNNEGAFILSYPLNFYNNNGLDLERFKHLDKNWSKRKKAFGYYFKYLFHLGLSSQIDEWILYSVFHKLHTSNIKYIIVYDNQPDVFLKTPWIETNSNEFCINYANNSRINLYNKMIFNQEEPKDIGADPSYHTSPLFQKKLAELLLKEYISKF